MSALKNLKKIGRLRKEAYQFRFTSTFEYMNVSCVGTWRPTSLRVVWYRNHRKVKSIPVIWKASEDRGPNGADGSAKFNPVFSVGLTVTLYKSSSAEGFEEKTYKYQIQDDRDDAKKILATFTLDLADFAREQTSEEKLDMTFKPVSKKVQLVLLGLTLTSEFVKIGNEGDCDMQSTYSAMTIGREVEEEEEGEREEEGHEGEREPAKASPVHGPSNKMRCVTDKHHGRFSNILTITGPPAHDHTAASSPGSCPRVSPLITPSPPSPSPSPLSPMSPVTITGEDRTRSVTAAPLFPSTPTKTAAGKGGIPLQRFPSLSSPSPILSGVVEAVAPSEDSSRVVAKMKSSIQRLEEENKILRASTEMQGWLYKRGVNGLTAHIWRRRYFHFDHSSGNKIYYYKTSCRSKPRGFIDLNLVLRVQEMEVSRQDKNNATFHIHCQGRTYQLQAIDHETMIRWMKAIQLLVEKVKGTKTMEHSTESSFYVI